MRRVFYVALASSALFFGSCSKQDIQPTSNTTATEPIWRSFEDDGGTIDPNVGDPGGITDPNVDPDENGRKN